MLADSLVIIALLFLAAGGGWYAARFFARARTPVQKNINPEYFKGLNYLLDDNPDKAIEVFVSMMAVDNETVETHFALGSLFRRRGEVDRAIRIHQNLIARPNLGREHRDQALFALAEDYLRAGLLDRAEGLFEKLTEQSSRRTEALRKLTAIYEQQQDWHQAIAARRKLGADRDSEKVLAHYYCELAQTACTRNDDPAARQWLKKAQASGPWLARGALMRADIARRAGDTKKARKLYQKVVESDARFMTEVWQPLLEIYAAAGDREGFAKLLNALVRKSSAALPQLTYAAIAHNDIDFDAVRAGLQTFLSTNSTLHEALSQLDVVDDGPVTQSQLQRIAGGLRALLRNRADYLCAHCGYASERLYWQCPGCKTWDSVRPNTRIPVDRLALAAG